MSKSDNLERILWSIAFPGVGQLLNRHYFKGGLFIASEFVINITANTNLAILASFYGDTETAVKITDYKWLMFYPCIYIFAIWDAYKNTEGEKSQYSFLPFVCSAFLGTIGVIYSQTVRIFGVLLGPIWLPLLCIIAGAAIGILIKHFFTHTLSDH